MRVITLIVIFFAALTVNAESAKKSTLSFSSGSEQVSLLELYTSEGCSSCPPAEAWFSQLQQHPKLWEQLVPVVFHVDYWDYLGWKDPFSSSQNSNRQRRYQRQGGINSVYTPGFVLNGEEWRNWFSRRPLSLPEKPAGQLDVTVSDNTLNATFNNDNGTKSLQLHAALLGFDLTTAVKAGENHGRELTHQFVVLSQSSKLSRNGHWQLSLPNTERNPSRTALAVWVTQPGEQQPIQATGGWLP